MTTDVQPHIRTWIRSVLCVNIYLCVSFLQPTALPQQNFSMHVAVPVSNPNAMYQAGGNLGSQALAAATASLNDSGMLSPPQASLHRNVGSGGGSQRPTSAGSAG